MTEDGTRASEDEFEPRARIVDALTGESRPVPKAQIHGLDSFADSWQHYVEVPHEMLFSAWQMADDSHPAGDGKPGYRVVHKTIRTVPIQDVEIGLSNLRITFQNGPVTLGEPRFSGAIEGRRSGSFLVPEWGTMERVPPKWQYKYEPNVNIRIQAHQETTPYANHIEILYHLPEGDWERFDEMMAAGRAGVASLRAMIDFMYGERLLGPVLTEEVGAIFEDWHWNRLLGGRTIAMESQARLDFIDGQSVIDRLSPAMDAFLRMPEEMRNRIKVAAQWYWHADAEQELVQRYISYWLCVEALELGENANIGPVKVAVADLLGVERKIINQSVGRMYGIRNGLVHGSIREVARVAVEGVESLAVALLELRTLGHVSAARLAALRSAVGLLPQGAED
ncbi:hypothetical protein ACPPVT_14395 [Angustibacter sp. McL0619]|uniref:hypothetical protein n=1 Tax=Angustibacter sp. McL0619 TaxID=3415676 RepID=UPI003CECD5A8